MRKESCVHFKQSLNDFPLNVSLEKKSPSWEISRWKNNHGLRFIPPDDEGFCLRGDKRRLVYKGRRRSHRFTILGDGAFEYDCILNKEPETNIVTLILEGAGQYDFFRQPDFVPDPFLKGSYAVYKKETLVGEGTGKLCHIHRPLIIDARGRKVWGDLSVAGNELRITIPEQWLAQAAYPVVVDPVIGTTTVGSQSKWEIYESEPPEPLMFEMAIPVNRFLVPETINGLCTAYAYANQDDGEAGGRPVFYSDNGNVPQTRKSTDEGFFNLRVNSGKPAGWRSATFKSNGSIASGSYIWFGVFCEYYWLPRFDWGAKCYAEQWYESGDSIPNTYPINQWTEIYDFKLSMYFDYTSAQNYVRTLTQGVRLTDSRKLSERFNRTMTQKLLITDNRKQAAGYKRSSIQTAKVNSSVSKFETFFRKCVFTVSGSMTIGRSPLFLRSVIENIKIAMGKRESWTITRKCFEDVKINSESKRIHNIILKLYDSLNGFDMQTVNLVILRYVNENLSVADQLHNSWAFIRSLIECAANMAETKHEAEYYRFNVDTVQAIGNVFRGLILFIRIITKVFIRDYLVRRFLAAREELALKSCITSEIKLESKIN